MSLQKYCNAASKRGLHVLHFISIVIAEAQSMSTGSTRHFIETQAEPQVMTNPPQCWHTNKAHSSWIVCYQLPPFSRPTLLSSYDAFA